MWVRKCIVGYHISMCLEGPKKDGSLRNGIANALGSKEKVSVVFLLLLFTESRTFQVGQRCLC